MHLVFLLLFSADDDSRPTPPPTPPPSSSRGGHSRRPPREAWGGQEGPPYQHGMGHPYNMPHPPAMYPPNRRGNIAFFLLIDQPLCILYVL